jgi:hypothetical protein
MSCISGSVCSQALVALEVQGVLSVRHGDGAVLIHRPVEDGAVKVSRESAPRPRASAWSGVSVGKIVEAPNLEDRWILRLAVAQSCVRQESKVTTVFVAM